MSLSLGIGLGLSQQRIGGGVPEILEYRDHTYTGASNTDPTIPADIVSGDLLIAMGVASSGSPVVPSGWTEVASFTGPPDSVSVVAKVSDGTETGSLQLFSSANETDRGVIIAFDGGLSSLGSIVDPDAEATDGNPTAQIKNASTLGSLPFLVFGFYSTSVNVITRTFSGDIADDEKGNSEAYIKWKFYGGGSSPADITIDMDDDGAANGLASAIIEVNF